MTAGCRPIYFWKAVKAREKVAISCIDQVILLKGHLLFESPLYSTKEHGKSARDLTNLKEIDADP